jgi:predicted DsbA family dithiol-disulfide isomerase
MHDALFGGQGEFDAARFLQAAESAGLPRTAFLACMSGEASATVQESLLRAQAMGLTSTPVFFFGTVLADGRIQVSRSVHGAKPLSEFSQILDELIKAHTIR